jgi:hypothetical protein
MRIRLTWTSTPRIPLPIPTYSVRIEPDYVDENDGDQYDRDEIDSAIDRATRFAKKQGFASVEIREDGESEVVDLVTWTAAEEVASA